MGSPTLSLGMFLLLLSTASSSVEKKPVQIGIQQAACGALLRDDLEKGDERKNFHDVLVEYDGQKQLARAFLNVGGDYRQLGKEEPLFRGLTQVELKLMDVTPLYGARREAHFDDCRLYPNPRHHPVRLVAVDDYPVRFPAATGAPYGLLYRGPRIRVALYTADGVHKISESFTDGEGIVSLPVDTPFWIAFPVAAMVRFYMNDYEVARSLIKSQGVKGLYPGDVWVFDTSQILKEKT